MLSARRPVWTDLRLHSLNRIATAAGSGWSETYGFDPFGNLTTKTGSNAPGMSLTVSQVNNRVGGVTYDANGNAESTNNGGQTVGLSYDVENHVYLVSANGYASGQYAYDAQNRRLMVWPNVSGDYDPYGQNNVNAYQIAYYSPSGQKLGTYQFNVYQTGSGNNISYAVCSTLMSSDQYFGSRRLAVMDQLGSAGANSSTAPSYFPWGEPRSGTGPQDTWSFATYWADSTSGLDYAQNRYYSNAYGRFMTPDPYTNSGRLNDPQSWNRYAYTRGDPVNRYDPSGMDDSVPYLCPVGAGEGTELVECFDVTVPIPAVGSGSSYQAAAANIAQYDQYQNEMNTWNRMTAAIQAAINSLRNNPGCDALFNIGGQGPDPVSLLQSMFNQRTRSGG